MYVTLPQSTLRTALSQVSHLAGGKSQLPILRNMLLEASWGELCLRASNEETSIRYRVAADVQASGPVLLPAKLLAEVVAGLDAAPVTLAVPAPKDPTKALLQCQRARVLLTLPALSCEEFPLVPSLEDAGMEHLFLVDCEFLKEVVEQVAFAAADDLSRPALGGVQVIIASGEATFAAADAFRMAMRTIAVPGNLTRTLLIPASALLTLARLLPDKGAVQVAVQDNQILFHTEQMDFATRLMHDALPNVRGAIPASSDTCVEMEIAPLTAALRLMAPFARANSHRLYLSIVDASDEGPAGMRLRAVAPDLGENEMVLPGTIAGPAQSLLVNHQLFAELLAAVPGDALVLGVSGERRPLVLRPTAALDAVSVIMPMHEQRTVAPSPTRAASAATPV